MWNGILTLLIIGILLFGNNTNKGIENPNKTDVPFPSDLLYDFKLDSLFKQGSELRRKILNEKIYNFNIPLQKGWVINVWQNGWPILSQIVFNSQKRQFPIRLDYGKNELQVVVWDSNQKVVFGDQFEIVYSNPVVDILRRPVERGSERYSRISLTFDGGANASGTEEILNVLEDKKLRTTIFLTGEFIIKYPELVKKMLNSNQEIGNHTFNHPHLTNYSNNNQHITLENVTREFMQKQLLSTDSIFYDLTDEHMAPFWRAPFGEYNQQILDWAAECGYMHIRWTKGFDTFDWVEDKESPIYKSSQQVYENILDKDNNKENLNGAIVLMHLGSNRTQDQVYKIIPNLIDELHSRGYTIVPISKLLNL